MSNVSELSPSGHLVLVYGQPGCQPCKATARTLDRAGVPHTYVDVTEDQEAHQDATSHGWDSTPVVEVRDAGGVVLAAWHGFRMEACKALAVQDVDVATLDRRLPPAEV